MTAYIIFFNQQWVGDHPAEWYESRGPLARAVVADMRDAGVLVFAGGLEEDPADGFSAEPTDEGVVFRSGPYTPTDQWLGGLTIVEVADEAEARMWAGRVAQACGWPQETRPFKGSEI